MENPTTFYVIFGKFIEDKVEGVYLSGVHFGGFATDHKTAEAVARDCVNNTKGGSIIAKIFTRQGEHQLQSVMNDAISKFNKLASEMIAAEDIMMRSNRRS